ncbi:MAG: type II toxin-antitoxin system PemK/MazF family toxin [Methylophilaceae bacterium]
MRVPARGEIWVANLNPTAGKEQQGQRPLFIVSTKAFNQSGLTVVCPITQGGSQSRFAGFAVSLMGVGTETQGVVMCNQPCTVDLHARNGKFVEVLPNSVTDEVMARVQVIFEPSEH